MDIQYRLIQKGEEEKACALIERVFNKFVAPDYEAEGIDEFFKYANPHALAERAGLKQVIVVAEQGVDFVGIIEMRACEHIAMLFVDRRRTASYSCQWRMIWTDKTESAVDSILAS